MNALARYVKAVCYPAPFRKPKPEPSFRMPQFGSVTMAEAMEAFAMLGRVGISLNRYLVAVVKEAREADRRFQAMEGFGKIPRGACRFCITGELHYLRG